MDKTAFATADSHFDNQLTILTLRTSAGDNIGQPIFNMEIKHKIANFFAKPIKNVKSGRFGRERFLLTRLIYTVLPLLGYDYFRGKEWDFVLRNLTLPPAKVLDVGSAQSLLIYEFYKRGYDTYGIDFNPHAEDLPQKIKFIQGDITDTSFPNNYFDLVVAVSVIEHVGIGFYNDPVYNNGDFNAIQEIHRMLLPKGILLLTVPSQEWVIKNKAQIAQRGYTCETINKLVENRFAILEKDCRMGQLLFKLSKI